MPSRATNSEIMGIGECVKMPKRPAKKPCVSPSPIKALKPPVMFQKPETTARMARINMGTTITVGMGTCGIAAGARDTMHAVLEELAKRQIDAHVTTVGCIGICIKDDGAGFDVEEAIRSKEGTARTGAVGHEGGWNW